VRLYLRSHERRPDPEPLQTNDRATVLAGIAVWAVLWVLTAVFHDQLDAAGRGWWIWTPPAGIGLGLVGLAYLRRHRRHGDH
jgi:hypothetical protein